GDAPDDMAERVLASLERKTLLGHQAEISSHSEGRRHLLMRKFATAAAMIILMAAFAAVVYTIVAPDGSVNRTADIVDNWQPPIVIAEVEKPEPIVEVAVAESSIEINTDENIFYSRLKLKTASVDAVNAVIQKAIENSGLVKTAQPVVSRQARGEYVVSGSPIAVSRLLEDIENIWNRLDSATLLVRLNESGDQIIVDEIAIGQIMEIVNCAELNGRVKFARDFSILNNIAASLPGRKMLAIVDNQPNELISIPRPVLTSAKGKTVLVPQGNSAENQQVNLTIEIIPSK
ncbi:MAG: hypothetical protein KAI59_01390, partial [Planctomycetes bacterium]|nr:hypothetical protein [Planctomycetota bacterium]